MYGRPTEYHSRPNSGRIVLQPPYGRFESVSDMVDRETRSRIMSKIRGKNTGPELLLRRSIHARGLRYRLHDTTLPGKPDLIFPRFHAVCFVHGCFWHRHRGCRFASTPKSRVEYWEAKLKGNVARDNKNRQKLLELGWRVAVVWECSLRADCREETVSELDKWLRGALLEHETCPRSP